MTLASGTRLGPYEILSPLGAGGMGEVYRARDRKLQREVAIKVLPQAVAGDPDARARFEREALAVAALSHPNILAIHDFGEDGGVSYAVMELLEGGTLREKLDAGPIPRKDALGYALQITRGLSAAHQKGVVHRDLKPENLFIASDGHLKILDFGLAKKVGTAQPGEQTSAPTVSGYTEPGTVLGTVGYMSPEQVRGQPVDQRSDVFSFGAILYELLSGQRAFRRQTAADTMSAILKEEPPELTGSGPALDHIVRHCLEKDRDDRFQSARDIAFALGETSSASGMTDPRASPRQARTAVLIGIGVLAAFALAGLLLQKRHRASPEGVKRIAVLPFDNLGAPEDDYLADGIADAVRGKLTALPRVQVIARNSSTPYKRTPKTPGQVARELDVDYLLTATVRWQKTAGAASRVEVSPELVEVSSSGAPTSRWQQPFDASLIDVFQVQSDIATRVAQALGLALGAGDARRLSERPTGNLEAYDAFLRGEEAESREGVGIGRRALEFYEKAVALDPGFVQAWSKVARVSSHLSGYSPDPELKERARVAAERTVALAPGTPEAYLAFGDYEESVLRDGGRALEQYRKGSLIAPGNADLVTAMAGAEKSPEGVVARYREAERLDPRSPRIKALLGWALTNVHRNAEARAVFDGGLSFAPSNLDLIENKVSAMVADGDLEGARVFLRSLPKDLDPTLLAVTLATYGDEGWILDQESQDLLLRLPPSAFDGDKGNWGLCLAQISAWRGDGAQARVFAEKAREALEEDVRLAPKEPMYRSELGLTLAYLGRFEEAIREGKGAVAMDVDDAYSRHQLVRIYVLAGEHEKALDELEALLKMPYELTPAWLKIDPNFDPLRSNPRFQRLVAFAK